MLTKVAAITLLAAATAFGAAGDIIQSFRAPGEVRGLAYDWSDGNMWYATAVWDACQLGKLNPTYGTVIGTPVTLSGLRWCEDIGYGYLIAGTRYVVATDSPGDTRGVGIYATTGSFVGMIPHPFAPEGITAGVGCDWTNGDVYLCNMLYTEFYKWGGSSWSVFAVLPYNDDQTGVATGWGRVFVHLQAPVHGILEFNMRGSLTRSFYINAWAVVPVGTGMATGRVNASGGEESVFIASALPAEMIYEVSIGDITNTAVTPASLGKIKALFN